MTVTVLLSAALLCIQGVCHHALVGQDTPTGSYTAVRMAAEDPLYGGDVLAFARNDTGAVFAIHRTWLGNSAERRQWRLQQDDPAQRVISQGCINIAPEVYDQLPDVATLEIVQSSEAQGFEIKESK